MDIKKTEKPQRSQLSCFAVLFTAQKLNYSQKASKGQSTPHFSKTTDNCSPNSLAVTLQAVVTLLLQSPQRPAKVFLQQLLCFKPSPGGLRKVTVPKALLTTMSFSCQLATLRDLLISGAHFFVLSSWYLFSEVNRLLMIQHPLQTLFSLGVDYLWLLKFSLQYYNK